eukprot:3875347-Prymnesium_polylepis.2
MLIGRRRRGSSLRGPPRSNLTARPRDRSHAVPAVGLLAAAVAGDDADSALVRVHTVLRRAEDLDPRADRQLAARQMRAQGGVDRRRRRVLVVRRAGMQGDAVAAGECCWRHRYLSDGARHSRRAPGGPSPGSCHEFAKARAAEVRAAEARAAEMRAAEVRAAEATVAVASSGASAEARRPAQPA